MKKAIEYINDLETRKTEETAQRLEQGQHVSSDDLEHLINHLSSWCSKERRKIALDEINFEIQEIYQNALTDESEPDKSRLAKLLEEKFKINKEELRYSIINRHVNSDSNQHTIKLEFERSLHDFEQLKYMGNELIEKLEHNLHMALSRIKLEDPAKILASFAMSINNEINYIQQSMVAYIAKQAPGNKVSQEISRLKNKFSQFVESHKMPASFCAKLMDKSTQPRGICL